MLLEESFDAFHVQAVVLVRLPLESGRSQILGTKAGAHGVFLVALVEVRHTWQLSAFPTEVAQVERVM